MKLIKFDLIKRNAFTLAEVLITLGVIGVVAALTLPNLISDYKRRVYETAFAKSVNFIANANKKLVADAGGNDLCYLDDLECVDANNSYQYRVHVKADKLDEYMKKLGLTKKKINLGDIWEDAGGSTDWAYVAKDGMCYYPPDTSFLMGLYFLVDTNCSKNPNKAAQDQFLINVDKNFKVDSVLPSSVCMLAAGSKNMELWAMYSCGAYLIENSYQMDYLKPKSKSK